MTIQIEDRQIQSPFSGCDIGGRFYGLQSIVCMQSSLFLGLNLIAVAKQALLTHINIGHVQCRGHKPVGAIKRESSFVFIRLRHMLDTPVCALLY